ncbi:diguanylate cyclase [Xinfangfangia sp. CPCC 101601]|uniref:diguanylate cyclase n=1 Tax=Pseudogemmobacter lacusdianii TaxID=3069608 RepID=A0ABU0VXN7_9RHOB|nr:diguanylate cyclase [Xinfangfangia sp. CPCC 101601]MDQ2065670.1 diguanylate cyclase [Xinfangfangia sp. CPCC 101601]
MHRRILIIDALATNRIVFKVKLSEAFYSPLIASDGQTGLALARLEQPDLVLLDLSLPDQSATEILRALRADPRTRAIPVIAVTDSLDLDERLKALSAGADDVLAKPLREELLLARLRNLLRAKGELGAVTSAWAMPAQAVLGLSENSTSFDAKGIVALVCDRPEDALRWKCQLQPMLRDCLVTMSPDQALKLAPYHGSSLGGLADAPLQPAPDDNSPFPATERRRNPPAVIPDIFVIPTDMSVSGAGLRLMSELFSRPATRHAAICLALPNAEADPATMAYDLGADDVVSQAVDPRELVLRLRILLRRKRQTDWQRASVEDGLRMAVIDPLTGLHNRRFALPRLAEIAAHSAREGLDFAVMVVDLDHFKAVNDRFGHLAGDRVLTDVALRLSDNLRISDLLARIGGEEFLVALPQTPYDKAQQVAQRLRQVISEHPIVLPSGEPLTVTASIGVAMGAAGRDTGSSPEQQMIDVADLVESADQALRASKLSGRNQVTFATRTAA